jgi:hypothetical protein
MRKFADISIPVEEVVVEGQPLLRVHVTPVNLKDWCLCLQLLQDGLIEAFTFRQAASSKRIEVARGEGNRCDVKSDEDHLTLTLSAHSLDFARHFFLRYYRDGVAEVDHIDIETEAEGYIIFTVAESLPPVSPETAKRRLGM